MVLKDNKSFWACNIKDHSICEIPKDIEFKDMRPKVIRMLKNFENTYLTLICKVKIIFLNF